MPHKARQALLSYIGVAGAIAGGSAEAWLVIAVCRPSSGF